MSTSQAQTSSPGPLRPRLAASARPPDPIIRTKLYRPTLTSDHISRNRVLKLLDRSLSVPVTVLSAPAGYGKSTLVSEWLTHQQCRSAWVSLDATESELALFLDYLLAAVETISAGACADTRALLAAPDLPSPTTLAAYLVNDLDRLPGPFLLVLDDYHTLRPSSPVHAFVEAVLNHAPRALHLVLISRNDVPWSLTTWRAKGRVNEPSFRELRFTPAEVAEFLRVAGCTVENSLVGKLDARIEGWPVGWRLLIQALPRRAGGETLLAEIDGTLPDIEAYLVGEVLERQSAEARDYLLKTAICERFCPELVDALCQPDGQRSGELEGRTFLQLLQRHGLFAISLDSANRWLRYHHVFQELLQAELRQRFTPFEVQSLHLRASKWFEKQGFVEEAIRHAIEGGNAVEAAGIVERHRHAAMDEERWRTVETWLDLIPAALKKERLGLLLAVAWVCHFSGRRDVLTLIVRTIESHLGGEEAMGPARAEVEFFFGIVAYWAGDTTESLRRLQKVTELCPSGEELHACVAQVHLALSRHRNGEGGAALEDLRVQIAAKPANARFLGRLLAAKAFLHLLSADAPPVSALARQLEEGGSYGSAAFVTAWTTYLRGASALQMHRLTEAKENFLRSAAGRHLIDKRTAVDGMAALALTHALLGETDRAADAVRELLEFVQGADDSDGVRIGEACRARLALLRGDRQAAVRWERGLELELEPMPLRFMLWIEIPAITRIRVRIAEGTERSLRAALEAIATLRPQLEATHFAGQLIEVVVLKAWALAKLEQEGAARDALREALTMAAPGKWVRPFVEAPIASQLETLADGPEHAAFVELIAASRAPSGSAGATPPLPQAQRGIGRSDLTNRELDILELAARRLKSKEIAFRLHISEHTVKDHLKRIYQKLGVGKRSDAVAAATAAGIIK